MVFQHFPLRTRWLYTMQIWADLNEELQEHLNLSKALKQEIVEFRKIYWQTQ